MVLSNFKSINSRVWLKSQKNERFGPNIEIKFSFHIENGKRESPKFDFIFEK